VFITNVKGTFFGMSETEETVKMAKYEKTLHTALHAQTSYHHGVNG